MATLEQLERRVFMTAASRGRKTARFHWVRAETGRTVCAGVPVDEDWAVGAVAVLESERCRARGCLQRWQAWCEEVAT